MVQKWYIGGGIIFSEAILMYGEQPKKLVIIYILDILKKHTDSEHTLTQKQIIDLLQKDYNMKVDRKSVKRNLLNLKDFGYEIYNDEVTRKNKNGEEETILTNWYLRRKFDDAELRMMIDGILFSGNIDKNNKKRLIEKIENLSNKYFSSKIKHAKNIKNYSSGNAQIFLTIEILDEAINNNKQVKFLYNEIGIDKKKHTKKDEDGTNKEYIINPYQLAVIHGEYYLICNTDKYNDISNYRVDRIQNISILDTPRKAIETLEGGKSDLDLNTYVAEHIYMFPGESAMVRFRAKRYLLNELYDWFGDRMALSDISEYELTVSVRVNLTAMKNWAVQYAVHTKILSPKSLVEEVKNDLRRACENYEL